MDPSHAALRGDPLWSWQRAAPSPEDDAMLKRLVGGICLQGFPRRLGIGWPRVLRTRFDALEGRLCLYAVGTSASPLFLLDLDGAREWTSLRQESDEQVLSFLLVSMIAQAGQDAAGLDPHSPGRERHALEFARDWSCDRSLDEEALRALIEAPISDPGREAADPVAVPHGIARSP